MANIYSIHLNDLETILMYAVKEPIESIDAWKKKVPLLGVCRLWTRILYPVVYRTAYIESGERINGSQFRKWKTNIDCIAFRGFHHAVNTLRISTHRDVDAAWSASQLTNILKFNMTDWSRILKLTILINYGSILSTYKKYYELESNDINNLVHKFLRYMPNVKSLTLYDLGFPAISISGFRILVLAYASQLQQLSITTCFPSSQLCLNAQLTSLCIGKLFLHISSLAIANVFAPTLQRLELYRLPKNYNWNLFYDYITPGQIYFDNLWLLEISYTPRHNIDTAQSSSYPLSCPFILHFPKLQVLKLLWCFPNCILLSAKFPAHYLTRVEIDNLSLEVMYEKLHTIKARQLYVLVRSDPPYNTTFYLAMNSAFGKLSHFTGRMLRVTTWNAAFDYEEFQLNYLDNLSFLFTTPIQIFKILPRAPRISKLSVDRLQFSDNCSLSAIENAAGKENSQLCLELKVLNIRRIGGISPRSAALAFIQHLITRAINLQELVVPADYKHNVIFIIGRMKQSMPHLENIVVASKIEKQV